MILSAQSIRNKITIDPFNERTVFNGMSYGLSAAGYDVRIREDVRLWPQEMVLASVMEFISLPNDVISMIADKSSWARKGVAVQNTIAEPGWQGYLTMEITYHGIDPDGITIPAGSPIAQLIFMRLDEPTEAPYTGKYQNQPARPVPAIFEKG